MQLIELPTIGKTTALRLKKLGLETITDLIFYYPTRYDDFSKIYPIKDLPLEQNITIKAKIELINTRRAWRKKMQITEAVVNDGTESIKIIWFNQPYLSKSLKQGDQVYFSGIVKTDDYGPHLVNPIYEKVKAKTTHTARIIPIYATTQGITQKQMRFFVSKALQLSPSQQDWLPEEIIKKHKLTTLNNALHKIHFPKNWDELAQAQNRIKFDELFLVQLYAQKSKQDLKKQKAIQLKFQEKEIKKFVKSLPFTLTDDQKKCAWQMLQDLEKKEPMNRLLEGDVGSGKTVVATLAMLNAALNKHQAVLMAPTEILAEQHYQTLKQLLPKQKISLLTRTRKKILKASNIFIGTHALIQKKIEFENLALAIVDEQHRFGVKQRKALKQKSGDQKTIPHLLSMTATPIPRSLALTVYGDLDLSIIKQKPKGRKPIITRLVTEDKRTKAYQFIRDQIKAKKQIFIVCPLIEASDKLGVKSVEETYAKLNQDVFPDLEMRILHGKIKPREKEMIMQDFKANKFPILIATSVIEVGVDIPQATIMMIEGAERFGLAQLHQFRGRVGRNEFQAYCLLFTETKQESTLTRLQALVESNDGFALAQKDLELRGPGDVYGTEQSGFLQLLKLATLSDHELIQKTQTAAKEFLPNLNNYPELAKKMAHFSQNLHLE